MLQTYPHLFNPEGKHQRRVLHFLKKILYRDTRFPITETKHLFFNSTFCFYCCNLYILLLGCCTRFSSTLIKWYSQLAKISISPLLAWPINEYQSSNLNWRQIFTFYYIIIHVFSINYCYVIDILFSRARSRSRERNTMDSGSFTADTNMDLYRMYPAQLHTTNIHQLTVNSQVGFHEVSEIT